MNYRTVQCDFLLNKITRKDKLFNGDYTLDPYQKCEFDCKYCDSAQSNTIYIKNNVQQILKRELETIRKGTIIIGSTTDPYQKAEEKYSTTRNLLKIVRQKKFPCHILTKSKLILRDIDILLSMVNNVMVTISIISVNDAVSDVFEKNLPSPSERLQIVKKLSEKGIKTGVAVIPVLPFIVEEELETIVKLAEKHRAYYVLHKHLELKGDQKNIFMKILEEFYSDLVEKYEKLYRDSYRPSEKYISKINRTFFELCTSYELKNKI